jgi:hypothetical protein
MTTILPLHHNESNFICYSFFLPYSFFLSLYKRRRWAEEGRREVPFTAICNQGNGQSPSDCETVAAPRTAPHHGIHSRAAHMNTSGNSLLFRRGCRYGLFTAEESFRYQASPCTIRSRPNHTKMCLSPITFVPPSHVTYHSTSTQYSYLIHLPWDGQGSHQRSLIHRDIPSSHDDNDLSYKMPFV